MHMVLLTPSAPATAVPEGGVVCHDVRDPHQHSRVLARKGVLLSSAQVLEFLASGVAELHLAVPEPGDVSEDAAAQRLASAVAGAGISASRAHFGQVTLSAASRGMLRVHADRLERVNDQDGALVLTAPADRPVEVGTPLGVVKCAPIFMAGQVLEAVESLRASSGAVIELQPFASRRVAFVAPRDRLRGKAFEQARASLAHALDWYGSSLEPVLATETTPHAVADGLRQAADAGVDLIFAAGASATDPCDVVFEGIRGAGGQVEQIGIPAEPGTACWIGTLHGRPVLGLASCELFGRPGALDLLLPRLLVGEALDRGLVRRLALGGLLVGGPSRVAPYHTANPAPQD